jgi:hypothetical protein
MNHQSKSSQVIAFVGKELEDYEFCQDIIKFLKDQSIDGSIFVNLTDQKLKDWGLGAGGAREKLLQVVHKARHPNSAKRRKRWNDLNEILETHKRFKPSGGAIAYSYLTWKDVEPVFGKIIVDYEQKVGTFPDDTFHILYTYLGYVSKSFGTVVTGKEAKRLHFIAPVLACVCCLFEGNVRILVEESLVGKNIKTTGNFEFILQREGKRICVVEAKKDDIEQGMAQDLLGCEAVADVENLDVVYGIVTNYIEWVFFKSFDDRIEQHVTSMSLDQHQMPTEASIRMIAGKIYAILSD